MSKESWKLVSQASSIGFLVVFCILIGLAIGYYIDKWLNTKPLFIVIFLFLGVVAAFYNLFKTVLNKTNNLNND